MSGGAFVLTEEPVSLDAVVAEVATEEAGAIATFSGTARRHSRGRVVSYLDYEGYEGMAEEMMEKLADALKERYDIHEVAIHHRVGRVELGEPSVVIAVSAAHRADALAACKDAIDILKVEVPALEERGLRGRRGVDRPRLLTKEYNGRRWTDELSRARLRADPAARHRLARDLAASITAPIVVAARAARQARLARQVRRRLRRVRRLRADLGLEVRRSASSC